RERVPQPTEEVTKLAILQNLIGGGPRIGKCFREGQFAIFCIVADQGHLTTRAASNLHQNRVAQNCREPGGHLRTAIELREVSKRREHSVLYRILRVVRIAQPSKSHSPETRQKIVQESVEFKAPFWTDIARHGLGAVMRNRRNTVVFHRGYRCVHFSESLRLSQ